MEKDNELLQTAYMVLAEQVRNFAASDLEG